MKAVTAFFTIAVLAGTLSCKAAAKNETKPKVPAQTVELQVLGGWKMGLPGPGENILTYDKKAPVVLKEGQKLLPSDGSLMYSFDDFFYMNSVADSLKDVFHLHPQKWDYNHISMATLFSFAFYTTRAVDTMMVSIKIDVDANLSYESSVMYHQDYTVTHTLPYTPEKNGYPPLPVIRKLYLEALDILAEYFEDDPWWMQKLE